MRLVVWCSISMVPASEGLTESLRRPVGEHDCSGGDALSMIVAGSYGRRAGLQRVHAGRIAERVPWPR